MDVKKTNAVVLGGGLVAGYKLGSAKIEYSSSKLVMTNGDNSIGIRASVSKRGLADLKALQELFAELVTEHEKLVNERAAIVTEGEDDESIW